jgi:hypothetical protein
MSCYKLLDLFRNLPLAHALNLGWLIGPGHVLGGSNALDAVGHVINLLVHIVRRDAARFVKRDALGAALSFVNGAALLFQVLLYKNTV